MRVKERNFVFISSDFVGGNIEKADRLLIDEIRKRYNLVKIDPSRVFLKLENGKHHIFSNGKSISSIDFALVRRTRGAEEKIYEIVRFLENSGVKVLDQSNLLFDALSAFNSVLKILKKFNTPDTYYCSSFADLKKLLEKGFVKFPVIVKPNKGFHGEGIVKVNSQEKLLEIADRFFKLEDDNLFFQEYIDIRHEYRVFVVGSKALGVVEKIAPHGAIARNYALGSKFVEVKKQKIKTLAESVCRELKTNFSGVDIVEDSKGKLYILECNRSPQFIGFRDATGIKVEEKIIEYFTAD